MNPSSASLEQLRDIHLPPAIGAWPPAPGWWLLALLVLITLTAAGLWLGRRWQRRRYRREALQLLNQYQQRFYTDQDARALLTALSQLLRRTALCAYPRHQVAALSGETWREFLQQHSGLAEFDSPLGDALVHGPYRPHPAKGGAVDTAAVIALTRRWIKRHRRQPC